LVILTVVLTVGLVVCSFSVVCSVLNKVVVSVTGSTVKIVEGSVLPVSVVLISVVVNLDNKVLRIEADTDAMVEVIGLEVLSPKVDACSEVVASRPVVITVDLSGDDSVDPLGETLLNSVVAPT